MSILEDINKDRKEAFVAKNMQKKNLLTFLKSQIQNLEIELGKEPNDEQIINLLKKEVKTRKESIEFLEKQEDDEGIKQEEQNIEYIKEYLPSIMDREETKKKLLEMIESLGITDLAQQRGKVMGAMMKQYGVSVDGSLLNDIVQDMLD